MAILEVKIGKLKYAVSIVISQVFQNNRDYYISEMVHKNGYELFAKTFYQTTGMMKKSEVEKLFISNEIPKWMLDVFSEVETDIFGTSIISHR